MNADHSHNTEVPDHECHRNVVHGNVIRLKNLTEEKKKKREKTMDCICLKQWKQVIDATFRFFYILLLNVVTQM